ncbi:Uncharacterised protein [Mycobacteroides abscessus subsp. abscessus]|nr:Uncharacterised protein [Mycobacteroides abscessus subsp. abscessus]
MRSRVAESVTTSRAPLSVSMCAIRSGGYVGSTGT